MDEENYDKLKGYYCPFRVANLLELQSRPEESGPRQPNLQSALFQPEHLEDVRLPRFGLVFFNHLIGEFDSFTGRADLNSEAFNKASQLKEVYFGNTRPLTWGDLAAMECLTLQLRTGPELQERFWAIQTRYREVAPRQFFPQDADMISRTVIQALPDCELRARIEVIASEFFRVCMLSMCREAMRAKASLRAWIAMFAFLAVYSLGLFLALVENLHSPLPAVLFAGAMGGFVSVQRRIQSVTDHGESLVGLIELSGLSTPLSSLWAPISGAIFAIVLYAMFAGGLVSGEVFPTIHPEGISSGIFLQLFCSACGPVGIANAAKVVLWCFVAGFAERFVPDAIARFVSKVNTNKKDQADMRKLILG